MGFKLPRSHADLSLSLVLSTSLRSAQCIARNSDDQRVGRLNQTTTAAWLPFRGARSPRSLMQLNDMEAPRFT